MSNFVNLFKCYLILSYSIMHLSKVETFSVLGTKFFEKTGNEDQMILIHFEKGLYFVKITSNEKQFVKK